MLSSNSNIGCENCVETFYDYYRSSCGLRKAPDTLPAGARTINNTGPDMTANNPWRSPGAAPMLDSCGLSGGSSKNNNRAGGLGVDTIARKQGARGSELPRLDAQWTLNWTAGEEVEVSWGISANQCAYPALLLLFPRLPRDLTQCCLWAQSDTAIWLGAAVVGTRYAVLHF